MARQNLSVAMLLPTYLFHFRSAIGMRIKMGTKRFETVFDYSKWGCAIAVTCTCGHRALLDPKEITKACIRRVSTPACRQSALG